MLNITNTDEGDKLPELDNVKIDAINDFKKTLIERGSICKNDVLALEEFVGYNVVTKDNNINKYTAVRTPTMYEETVEYINNVTKSLKDTTVTLRATLELCQHLIRDINEITTILTNMTTHTMEEYKTLIDPIYSNTWEGSDIVDLSEIDVSKVILDRYRYLSECMNKDMLDELVKITKEHHIFTLANLLVTNKLGDVGYRPKMDIIETVTFKRIIKTVLETPVLNQVRDLRNFINETKNDLLSYKDDYTVLVRTHKQLTMLHNLIDNDSKLLLRAINSVTYK